MFSRLSTNRSRVGALTFATLLLAGFTSCTNQYQADERPKASSATDNETATVETAAIPVADRTHFPVLADAYRRVDPKADGWGTEAFSEQASAKLKYLKAYLNSGQIDDLNSLVAPSAQSTAFFPSEFNPLHSSGILPGTWKSQMLSLCQPNQPRSEVKLSTLRWRVFANTSTIKSTTLKSR